MRVKIIRRLGPLAGLCLPLACLGAELNRAAVWTPADLSGPERKAVQMLIDETEVRSQIRWEASSAPAPGTGPVVYVGRRDVLKRSQPGIARALRGSFMGAEGYELLVTNDGGRTSVIVAGNDARGVLFGVGRLLRTLQFSRGNIRIPEEVAFRTVPKYALRGHQLGYRPKTNAYDAWSVPMWEQYIRDLTVFGANAIELIPPRSDDDDDSPHFPLPPMRMMVEMSRLANEYGLDCWIWYPAMDKDYSDPKTVEFALKEWEEVYRQLPRIDAVFVPGGDPGHTQPKYLMALLEKQAALLRKYHPRAQMWVSPQSFSGEWMDEFFEIVKREPAWLGGVVYGPQTRISMQELRAKVPTKYPIRFYPDITHTIRAQYPVPDWDISYALTLNREPINPRPVDQARIFRLLQPIAAYGFLTYSEGCNDDVNKFVWSGLGWDPDANVVDILREYSRYFIGNSMTDTFAQGLLALERNWRGPLASNAAVDVTLAQFRQLEREATPQQLHNWRFQQALYRAYYDAYVGSRLLVERGQEEAAMEALRQAPHTGALNALASAEDRLKRNLPALDLRARVFELAEALFQSVRMQLSVERYKAIAVGRGANLDLIDMPLNNAPWLKKRFEAIRELSAEAERLRAIDGIVNWSNPGAGGFYDDLGDPANRTHLVRGEGAETDPAFLKSSQTAFGGSAGRLPGRLSWWSHAETLYDQPLEMKYSNLDRDAKYRVRVIYGGDSPSVPVRLMANGRVEIHTMMRKPADYQSVEFDIPQEATASGELQLVWTKPLGLGGNGRGVQVSEVWLMRKETK
jgi:hypothetical protein